MTAQENQTIAKAAVIKAPMVSGTQGTAAFSAAGRVSGSHTPPVKRTPYLP